MTTPPGTADAMAPNTSSADSTGTDQANGERGVPQSDNLVTLGRTDLHLRPMGVGTWAWGDRRFWGYGKSYGEGDVHAAFDASLAAGITLFDTAEIYGFGQSERLVGRLVAEVQRQATGDPARRPLPLIATKFFPFPWRLTKSTLERALRHSLQRLQTAQVDLYQMHWSYPPVPVERWAEALADALEIGLTRAVGVSNYNVEQMRRSERVLATFGHSLASNQVRYSLLHRAPERNGVLDACRDMGVTLIAYSPLEQGLLTGKYSTTNPPPGFRSRLIRRYPGIDHLVRELRAVGEAHGGKTPAQVSLNWAICKGAVPIPGAKRARQAAENAAALGWRLTPDEVERLDRASDAVAGR